MLKGLWGSSGSEEVKRSSLEDASPLGAYLEPHELLELSKLCSKVRAKAGQSLPESPFYVVISGQVQVKEGDVVLCHRNPGTFFTRRAGLISVAAGGGFFSRRSQDANRKSAMADNRKSIVKSRSPTPEDDAEEDTPLTKIVAGAVGASVLCIKGNKLVEYLETKVSDASHLVINSILRTNIGTQLAQVPFIEQAGLDAAGLRALGECCSYAVFQAGKYVFNQGDAAENFYIILKGQVEITIDVKALRGTGDDKPVVAATRLVGDSFGVAALVYNAAARKYSAQAIERTLCLVIAKPNLDKFLSQKPSLENALMRTTKRFLLQRYQAMNVPIFGNITSELMDRAADLASFVHFEKGDTVYKQGDPPHAFYVVLHGEVKMTTVKQESGSGDGDGSGGFETSFIREASSIAVEMMATEAEQTAERLLTVGNHFGEVGVLLPQTPCIATATATAKSSLLCLESSAFIELFGSDLNLLAEMQIKLLHHRCTLHAVLNHTRARPLFEKHIASEYSQESILFYDAVSAFVAEFGTSDATEDGISKAKELIKEYVVDMANQQVNIPGPLQRTIVELDKKGAGEFDALVGKLKEAQGEIYTLMARDNFPRFTKTPAYEELLKEIGSYGATVTTLVSSDDLAMLVQDGEGGSDNLMQAHLAA